jgi:hypothetical protein
VNVPERVWPLLGEVSDTVGGVVSAGGVAQLSPKPVGMHEVSAVITILSSFTPASRPTILTV